MSAIGHRKVGSQSPCLLRALAVTLRHRQLHQPDIPTLDPLFKTLQHYPRLLLRPRDRIFLPVSRGPTFRMLDQYMRCANLSEFGLYVFRKLVGIGACGWPPLRRFEFGIKVVRKLFGVGPANFPGRGEAGGLKVGIS